MRGGYGSLPLLLRHYEKPGSWRNASGQQPPADVTHRPIYEERGVGKSPLPHDCSGVPFYVSGNVALALTSPGESPSWQTRNTTPLGAAPRSSLLATLYEHWGFAWDEQDTYSLCMTYKVVPCDLDQVTVRRGPCHPKSPRMVDHRQHIIHRHWPLWHFAQPMTDRRVRAALAVYRRPHRPAPA